MKSNLNSVNCLWWPLVLCIVSGITAQALTLCDEDLFSSTMVNVGYNTLEIYRYGDQWNVYKLNYVTSSSNISMPAPILEIVNEEVAVLVAKNWQTKGWLALTHNHTVFEFESELSSWPLVYEEHVNTLFYSPLDQQFYAIAGSNIFAINEEEENSTVEFQPTEFEFDMSQVKLVLFTAANSMFLIEKTRFCSCNVTLEQRLHFECSNWRNGDLICTKGQLPSSSLFWNMLGLLFAAIAVLIILMVCCNGKSGQANAHSESNAKANVAIGKGGSDEPKMSPKQQAKLKPQSLKATTGAPGKSNNASCRSNANGTQVE